MPAAPWERWGSPEIGTAEVGGMEDAPMSGGRVQGGCGAGGQVGMGGGDCGEQRI